MTSRVEVTKRCFTWLLFTACLLIVLRNVSGVLHELGHSLLRLLFTGVFPRICIRGSAWMPLSWRNTGGPQLEAALDAELLVTLGGSLLPLLTALLLVRLPWSPNRNRGTLRIAAAYLALFQAALWTKNSCALWTSTGDHTSDAFWLLKHAGLINPIMRGTEFEPVRVYESSAPLVLFLLVALALVVLLRLFWRALFASAMGWVEPGHAAPAAVLVSIVALAAVLPSHHSDFDLPLLSGTSASVSLLSVLALPWSRPQPLAGPSRRWLAGAGLAAYLITAGLISVVFSEPAEGDGQTNWNCIPRASTQPGV